MSHLLVALLAALSLADDGYQVEQITRGPLHHFFGYIGHVGTIPWSGDGRYIVALRTTFQDRLPKPEDAAEIVLLDTTDNYAVRKVDETRAWNPQQGTMLYWNPETPRTQFFFNDRDLETGRLFTVLFDIEKNKRVREYRFEDASSIANSGVRQTGGAFLAINYGRLARLRPVTGYPSAFDGTEGVPAPANDGVFKVDTQTGEKSLLVSYESLAASLEEQNIRAAGMQLFINHTLWNRDGDRILLYVRANFRSLLRKLDVPCTIDADGGGLRVHRYFGGHPEWESGHRLIGAIDGDQVIYDTDKREVVRRLGPPGAFTDPGGDIALSPAGQRFVNGSASKRLASNHYTVLLRPTGRLIRTQEFDRGRWIAGALRLDPSPCWNRDGTKILVPGIADDETRQLFVIHLDLPPE